MTTFENASLSQIMVMKLGQAITKRRDKAKVATQARTWFSSIVRLILHLSGFGCLTYAGFTVSMTVGLIVAGMSCFVLSALSTTNTPPTQQSDPMANRR